MLRFLFLVEALIIIFAVAFGFLFRVTASLLVLLVLLAIPFGFLGFGAVGFQLLGKIEVGSYVLILAQLTQLLFCLGKVGKVNSGDMRIGVRQTVTRCRSLVH